MSQLVIQNTLVVSSFQKSMTYSIHHNDMIEYLGRKWEIDVNILHESVAWPSIVKARKQASFLFQKFISKWILSQALLCVATSNEYMITALGVMPQKNVLCTSLHAHILTSDH